MSSPDCANHTPILCRRIASIEKRLQQLACADLQSEVQTAWDAHLGTLCHGLSWDLLDRESLAAVAACIGKATTSPFGHVIVFLSRLLLFFRATCSELAVPLINIIVFFFGLGNKVMVGVCDLLAQDYRNRTGGLPDLVLWRQQGQ